MTLHDHLTRLIEKALEIGWDRTTHGWRPEARARSMAYGYSKNYDHAQITELLFGSEVSFLKSLFPNQDVAWHVAEFPDKCPLKELSYEGKDFHPALVHLAVLDVNSRIPWLYSHVFGGEDE